MTEDAFLENFVNDCVGSINDKEKDRFMGWESLVTVLVYQGLLILLPELKEWLKLGASVIALKRQEIRKRLVEYAAKKELDFPQAETAATKVSERLDEATIKKIVDALEARAG
jgi:hypothetical protein